LATAGRAAGLSPDRETDHRAQRQGVIRSVIVKLASRCNLNCSYCYLYNHEDRGYLGRPKFMSEAVFAALLERILEYSLRRPGNSVSLVFHGGEPMLMPAARFDSFATLARERLGERLGRLSIQTNATRVDGGWTEALVRHGVSVGVSLDGPPQLHDSVRVDHGGRGSHAATLAGLLELRAAGLSPQVLCVVNPEQSGVEAYRHFRDIGIEWMNFLLPDVSHDNWDRLYGGLGPTPVADYLIPAFDAWMEEDDPDVVVGLFWELLQRLMGGPGMFDSFGNPLMSYLVVETDGSIEALDALKVCGDGIAASGLNVLEDGFDDLARGLPLVNRAVHEGFPVASKCRSCEVLGVCGGGYLPHRYARRNGFDNPSVWCRDILLLLGHLRKAIERG
jgi:uncharacterized protein